MIEVILIVDSSSAGSFDVAKLVSIYCYNSSIKCHLVCQTESLEKSRDILKALSSISKVCSLNLATPVTLLGVLRARCSNIRTPSQDNPEGNLAAVINIVGKERIDCRAVESWDCSYIEYEVEKSHGECMVDIVGWIGLLVKKHDPLIKAVGVIMSIKRIRKLSAKEFLPLVPLVPELHVIFIPIHVDAEPKSALKHVDALLIKYSDFLVGSVDWTASLQFSDQLQKILEYNEQNSHVPYIDGLPTIHPVLDRKAMYQLLDTISKDARNKSALPVRAAGWDLIESTGTHSGKRLIPCIVKTRIACGVSESHHMGLILKGDGLQECDVPLPWVLQEYINHRGMLWKVYVAHDSVMFEQRNSLPNIVATESDSSVPSCIEFDSLKSLPTRLPWLEGTQDTPGKSVSSILTEGFFKRLGSIVRSHVKLSVFGFDVVFDYEAGEAVIIDLNYLPSFGNIDNAAPDFIKAFV
ncbi:hypothetical protein M9434_001085 [Picochlorum sp. BPE23]|nr:hypothetical protein M9434_001085 [Picochlorum sp. BPE23]